MNDDYNKRTHKFPNKGNVPSNSQDLVQEGFDVSKFKERLAGGSFDSSTFKGGSFDPSKMKKGPDFDPAKLVAARSGGKAGGMGVGATFGPPGKFGPVARAKNFKGTLYRFLRYFKPYIPALVVVLLSSIIGTVFNVLSPKILGLATTEIFEGLVRKLQNIHGGGINFDTITRILLGLAGLYIVSAIFSYIQQAMMARIAQGIIYTLRKAVDEKLARLPLKFFDSRSHGDILSRAINDLDTVGSVLQQSLTQFITAVVTLVGIILLMFSINWILSLIIVATLPLSLFVTTLVAKRSQPYFIGQQRSLGVLSGHVEEMYTGHTIVKSFGYEQQAITQFKALNDTLYNNGWRAQFITGTIMPLISSIGNLDYTLVAVIGGIMVAQGSLAIGDVQALILYARMFSMPIIQQANITNIIQAAVASAERVFELLDETEEHPDTISQDISRATLQGSVQFDHVDFSYTADTPLIQDLSIHAQPGQLIAIVGPTGAGKTTLVNLLMRFYELRGGRILLDGTDITSFQRGQLRRSIGMVLQDTWLFSGTIRDNIAYGCENATDAQIIEAARAAYADHFIKTLPNGYNTQLNQEMADISQGQKQLLTIARAILANPPLLVLDEATSSVDTHTEMNIQKALSDFTRGHTCFVIAHRLSTIRDADLILVMNHGSIVEQGTHHQLLDRNGFYAELYRSQFTLQRGEETDVL